MSEINMEAAKAMYETVCSTLDSMKINYTRHDEDLVVSFCHRGEDMNHQLLIMINAKSEVIRIVERLPYEISEDKMIDVALAVCFINNRLVSGGFTYALDKNLNYEVAQVYSGSLIGEETVRRMIMALVVTVEEYDDKFMALNKGYLKITDLIKAESEE